jgi:hypothetical protein
MENLAILANIAEIVGAIIVVVGLLFAVLQMRQIQQQRRELAAIELFRFFGNPLFTRAFNRVLHMPDKLTAKKMRQDEQGLEDTIRKETGNKFIFEWFQWLVVQLEEHDDKNERPAYEAFSTWIPQHQLKDQ